MAGEEADTNVGNRLLATESSLPNINTIWDLRRLLKFSRERLEELKKTPIPDNESIELERAIIKGVSKEIKRLEREVLYCHTFLQ